jgi:hypothetical protein
MSINGLVTIIESTPQRDFTLFIPLEQAIEAKTFAWYMRQKRYADEVGSFQKEQTLAGGGLSPIRAA